MRDLEAFVIRRLRPGDMDDYAQLMAVFAEAFDDVEAYSSARPGGGYVDKLLADDRIVALVARDGDAVVGGLVAYELRKLEQARSELYIYDLAVLESHRRRGVATALIGEVRGIARACNAWMVFVQADRGDEPAVALYSSLGDREDVLHFDIEPGPPVRPNRPGLPRSPRRKTVAP